MTFNNQMFIQLFHSDSFCYGKSKHQEKIQSIQLASGFWRLTESLLQSLTYTLLITEPFQYQEGLYILFTGTILINQLKRENSTKNTMGNQSCSELNCLKRKMSLGFLPQSDSSLPLSKNQSEETKCSSQDRSNPDLGVSMFSKKKTKINGFDSFLISLSEEEYKLEKANEDRAKDSTEFRQMLQSQDNLQETRDKVFHEIFLHIDEIWLYNIRGPKNDQIDLSNIYQEKLSHSKVLLTRVGHNGRNLNILFKEQIPRMGVHFFEVDLISFKPCHRNEFRVGVIEYEKAKFYPFNKGCFEQGYFPQQKYYEVSKEDQNKDFFLLITIRIEVCREKDNSYIAFFLNGKLERKEELLPQFSEGTKAIVPYIQSKYEGTTFSWKKNSKANWLPSL